MKTFLWSALFSVYFAGILVWFGPTKEEDMVEIECRDYPSEFGPCYAMKEPGVMLIKMLFAMLPCMVLAIRAVQLADQKEEKMERSIAPTLKPIDRGPKSEGNLVNLHEFRVNRYFEGLRRKNRP